MRNTRLFAVAVVVWLSACFPFEYHEREPALVEGVDMEQSIQVATDQLAKTGMEQGLSIWVLRDQFVTPDQARRIGALYLDHIDAITDDFAVWHTSWAISNLYRWGDDAIKAELETAFAKAKTQPDRLSGWMKDSANNHINGEQIYSGWIHAGGESYAYGHLVVPGNPKFIQSYAEYRDKQPK